MLRAVFLVAIINLLRAPTSLMVEAELNKTSDKTEIVMVHVIFRHGERSTYRFYPTDPNINNTFYPIGPGGLTNNGKLGEFKLGQFLRKQYPGLIGDIYLDTEVEARSTHTARTIMSAQLVLAGLFPPVKQQLWHPEIQWQPIPVLSKLKPEEDLLHPEICPKKLAAYETLMQRRDVKEKYIKPFEKLFRFVEEKSGMSIRNMYDLLEFYFIVNTEEDMKLPLPAWVKSVYPEPIYSTVSLTYNYLNFDEEVLKINAGYLMKKIIEDSLMRTNGTSDMKLFLYSGHESTLGYLLYALGVLKPHVPPYGSAILVELHKNQKNNYFVKLRYRDNSNSWRSNDLSIPGCNVLCPLQEFIALQNHYLPTVSIEDACKL